MLLTGAPGLTPGVRLPTFPPGRAIEGPRDPSRDSPCSTHPGSFARKRRSFSHVRHHQFAKGGGLQDRTCWPAGLTGPPGHRGRSSNPLSQGGLTHMHKRMTRILSAISLLVVIPTAAFASSSRIAGLGVPGDYVKDYTGIFTYVSGVSSVGNLVYAEPNTDPAVGGQAMGAVLGNLWEGRMGTWALHMRRFSPALGQSTFG